MPDINMEPKFSQNINDYWELIPEIMQDWRVKGSAIAVIKADQVIYSKGFGLRDIKNDLPVDSKTIFAIGSTSKAFTSVSLGILVDRGVLDWDKPLKDYVPDFKLFDRFTTERITARDLLSHRSGLPRHDAMWYGTSASRAELFYRLRYLQPNRDFRTAFQYQNLMFMVAGYLVEILSGFTWEEFVENEIFNPLGMLRTNTSVDPLPKMENVSKPYIKSDNDVREVPYRNLDSIAPAGSINSCLEDMSKWLIMQLNGGEYKGKQILSTENLKETHFPTTIVNQPHTRLLKGFDEIGLESYGLGWFIHSYRGHTIVRHGGHIDGFTTQVSMMPQDKLGVIVLSNIGGSSYAYVPTFEIYDRLLGLDPINWNKRILGVENLSSEGVKLAREKSLVKQIRDSKPSHQNEEYAGEYEHPGYGKLLISLDEKNLKLIYNGENYKLEHYHFDVFEASTESGGFPLKINFSSDISGNIDAVYLPLEPNVPQIKFQRCPSAEMFTKEFLQKFTGKYRTEGGEVKIIQKNENQLAFSIFEDPLQDLIPYRGNEFLVKNFYGWHVEFVQNENGDWDTVEVFIPNSLVRAKRIK